MCVCVYTCACATRGSSSKRQENRSEGDGAGRGTWGQTPSFLRAHPRAHTHITQSHTQATGPGRRGDGSGPEGGGAAGSGRVEGRARGGSPRFRSPGWGARALTGPETASQTLVGAHAHPLPSSSPPAASRPDDGSLQIPGLRAPRTADRAPRRAGRTSRASEERAGGRTPTAAEPGRAGRSLQGSARRRGGRRLQLRAMSSSAARR